MKLVRINLVIILMLIFTILSCSKSRSTDKEDINAVIKLAEKRYPGNENVKNAVIQFANTVLLDLKNPENARKTHDQNLKSVGCLYLVTNGDYSFFKELEKEIINTSEKNHLYLKYNAKLSGLSYTVPIANENDCDFKIK